MSYFLTRTIMKDFKQLKQVFACKKNLNCKQVSVEMKRTYGEYEGTNINREPHWRQLEFMLPHMDRSVNRPHGMERVAGMIEHPT